MLGLHPIVCINDWGGGGGQTRIRDRRRILKASYLIAISAAYDGAVSFDTWFKKQISSIRLDCFLFWSEVEVYATQARRNVTVLAPQRRESQVNFGRPYHSRKIAPGIWQEKPHTLESTYWGGKQISKLLLHQQTIHIVKNIVLLRFIIGDYAYIQVYNIISSYFKNTSTFYLIFNLNYVSMIKILLLLYWCCYEWTGSIAYHMIHFILSHQWHYISSYLKLFYVWANGPDRSSLLFIHRIVNSFFMPFRRWVH